jgi:hypothetical protein
MTKSRILSVQLLDRKDGTGNFTRVTFGDPSTGLRASRLMHADFAGILQKGDEAEVEVKKMEGPARTFKGTKGEDVTTNVYSVAVLKGESDAIALDKSTPATANVSADVQA